MHTSSGATFDDIFCFPQRSIQRSYYYFMPINIIHHILHPSSNRKKSLYFLLCILVHFSWLPLFDAANKFSDIVCSLKWCNGFFVTKKHNYHYQKNIWYRRSDHQHGHVVVDTTILVPVDVVVVSVSCRCRHFHYNDSRPCVGWQHCIFYLRRQNQ